MDYWSGRARTNAFLVRFDPVGGDHALGGLEIQLAGAYELVELPLKRIFHIGVLGQCFCRLAQRLRMELEPPTTAELSDQLRNPQSCTA